jgi:hypothetical protein
MVLMIRMVSTLALFSVFNIHPNHTLHGLFLIFDLIPHPHPDSADFGQGFYNDHHFHFGYFLYAFAVIAELDAEWIYINHNYLSTILLYARDIANPAPDSDHYFTRFRHFDGE